MDSKSLPLQYKIRMALHTQNGQYFSRLVVNLVLHKMDVPHYCVLKYCSNLVLHPWLAATIVSNDTLELPLACACGCGYNGGCGCGCDNELPIFGLFLLIFLTCRQ